MCGLKESLVDEQTDGHTGRRIKEATYKLTNIMKKLTGQPKNKMRDRRQMKEERRDGLLFVL